MEMTDLITPDRILSGIKAANKKQILQELSKKAAEVTQLDDRHLFDVLLERERLGSTGVGAGIAIPHGKVEIPAITGIFAKLAQPIDFDSIDEQPVDLIFLLLAPSSAGADHLKALARVSRLLRDRAKCEKLRGAERADAIYALLTEDSASSHAA